MLYALNKNKISTAGPHNGSRRQQKQQSNEQHFGELSKMQLNNEIKNRDYNNSNKKNKNKKMKKYEKCNLSIQKMSMHICIA